MADISIGGPGQHKPASKDDPIFRDVACKGVDREVIERFLEAWAVYPARRGGNPRRMALRAWIARVRAGHSTAELVLATKNYRRYCEDAGASGTQFVLHGATFYGPNERWKDFIAPQAADTTEDEMAREIRETWMRGHKT